MPQEHLLRIFLCSKDFNSFLMINNLEYGAAIGQLTERDFKG